jgi:hypothetical protein
MSVAEMFEEKFTNCMARFAPILAEAGFAEEVSKITWETLLAHFITIGHTLDSEINGRDSRAVLALIQCSLEIKGEAPERYERVENMWRTMKPTDQDKAWRYAQFFLQATHELTTKKE